MAWQAALGAASLRALRGRAPRSGAGGLIVRHTSSAPHHSSSCGLRIISATAPRVAAPPRGRGDQPQGAGAAHVVPRRGHASCARPACEGADAAAHGVAAAAVPPAASGGAAEGGGCVLPPRRAAFACAAAFGFAAVAHPAAAADAARAALTSAGVRGTVLIAGEGVNASLAGTVDDVTRALDALRSLAPGLRDMAVRWSWADAPPFKRLRVRAKPEIVTLRRPGFDRRAAPPAPYIAPEVRGGGHAARARI